MPTNLPPDYYTAEERYKAAGSPAEKIEALEELIRTVPKHKGTDHLRADLRRRLSKLKEGAQAHKRTGRQESAYHIRKEGAGQAVLVGPANVGKSSLVRALTNAEPEVAEYPYTTWAPTPGMMPYENIQVQLIDTPPLDREFLEPQLIDLIRRADLVLLVVDIQTYPIEQLETAAALLAENRIVPEGTPLQEEGYRRITALPFLVLVNKVDDEALEEDFLVLEELVGDQWTLIPVSATTGRNFDGMKQAVYDRLEIIRVYAKPAGEEPDLSRPFVLKQGGTVEEFAAKVHMDFYENLKTARVWGSGVFEGQPVGRDYPLQDGDIVELRI